MNRRKVTHIVKVRSGFALISTLMLMILLAILCVGMLGLSAVSIRSSSRDNVQAEAQANARMALLIALGRLQELAGDDRRVTATADLRMDQASDHASRYWTGVWSNAAADTASQEIYTRTPEAKFEGWLVSGERALLSNEDSTTLPLGNGVTLVGAGTAGSSVREHVTVPLVEVHSGLKNMTGRYGWWVGDEGVKTRGNLPSTANPTAAASDLTLGERGGGWEVMDGMESYPERGVANEATLARVFTVPSMSVAVPSLRTVMPNHFHSFTVDSRGLLSDTLAGGLRMDLAPYLENGFPSSAASNSFPNAPVSGKNIIPASVAPNIMGPTWDRLYALSTMRPPSGGSLTVAAGNGGDQAHITPVLFDVRLLLGIQLSPEPGSPTAEYRMNPCGKIAVSLANPYSRALRWNQPLHIELVYVRGAITSVGNMPTPRKPYFSQNPSTPSVFGNLIFTIPAGELPPGGAQAYTMINQIIRPETTAPVTVPLGPFLSSSPSDFNRSVIMQHSTVHSGNTTPEVSEQGFSAVIAIELRTSSSDILQRLEAFDLNNPAIFDSRRSIGPTRPISASTHPQPLGMMLYSFQISQPGMDYGSLLPDPSQLGIRNSTQRTYADFNLRARLFPRPIAGYSTPPFFMELSDALNSIPSLAPGGDTGPAFTKNLVGSPLRWGHSAFSDSPHQTILFDTPEKIVSLAQFQHADLTANDRSPYVSIQPGNALGNSYASPFVKRHLSSETRYDYVYNGGRNNGATGTANNYYDMSYLLNASLWDSFFISTIPATGSIEPLNKRISDMRPELPADDLRDPLKAASRLYIEGAFNVNSTRKDAWKALLASNRKLRHPAESAAPAESVMFPRSLSQIGDALLPKPSGDSDDSFNGFRRLDDAQLDALAEEITKQIRIRGPFLSLSHFINRALVELTVDDENIGRSGTLQSAIDNSGLNMVAGSSDSGFANLSPSNNEVRMQADGVRPMADMPQTANTYTVTFNNHPSDTGPIVWALPTRSIDGNVANTGSMLSNREMLTDAEYRPEQGFRSTGIPGWLTQADVLQVIGPVISVRSDTFRIRAYGEVLDSSGKVAAKAWCEAIVQRTPEFVEPSNAPETRPSNLNPINAKFGRRFSVVSFRWLNSDEI